jgi:hypothetical protein
MTRQFMRACVVCALPIAFGCGGRNPTSPSPAAAPAVASPAAIGGPVAAAPSEPRHSEQVVFSGNAATNSTFAGGSSVAFWIWCEAESTNPYAGECNGAMTFAADHLTRHVEDASITELSDGVYRISVVSTRDDAIACTLTNTAAPVSGPRNTVRVECTTPSGSATSMNAVVNVTGPGD